MSERTVRRWLVPEVVQTSAMDCGPASLKAMLEGHGITISYGRLREACQTDVDGTSIDTLEDIAGRLGLDVEQTMLPVDHLLLHEASALPALIVVRLPNGLTHFTVVWSRHGQWVQLMDPASGRRWVTAKDFLPQVFVHTATLASDVVAEWLSSASFLDALRARIRRLGALGAMRARFERLTSDGDWRALATLDAVVRMVQSIVDGGGLRSGSEATAALESIHRDAVARPESVPDRFWTVRAHPDADDEDGQEVELRGAVMLSVQNVRRSNIDPERWPELALALGEPKSRPARELVRMLREDGALTPAALGVGLAAAVAIASVQVLLLRALLEVGRDLGPIAQRLAAVGALVLFLALGIAVELPVASGVLSLGRRLETRFRLAFLQKMPRLEDRYFASRPTSDMAERSHVVHTLRQLPMMAAQIVRCVLELVVTAGAIAWLDRSSAGLAIAISVAAVAFPLLAQPVLVEREMQARTHLGAIGRFYLDAMLGLVPIRAHGAERAVRQEHEALVTEWTRAARGLVSAVVGAEGAQVLVMLALTIALVFSYLARAFEPASVLLLLYWALGLPVLGQELAVLVREYPAQRNVTLRLLEPLGAREAEPAPVAAQAVAEERSAKPRGVRLAFREVGLVASGHTILEGISVDVHPGEHVAVVGASGAGKSSLVGALLGWHRASSGRIFVDGAPIEAQLETLRQETAWIDPGVRLWSNSLFENLTYGADGKASTVEVLETAELHGLLEALGNEGMSTALGEGGALVSGGEGQRVRLGRALGRPKARLVIMDEPFRGLDRGTRRRLLARARAWFGDATLICITHDVTDTQDFERVLVLEAGRLVEDDAPSVLVRRERSIYGTMLETERSVHDELWAGDVFRTLRLEGGRLVAAHPGSGLVGNEDRSRPSPGPNLRAVAT